MVPRTPIRLVRHVDWLTVSAAALVALLIVLLALLPARVISSQLQSDTRWIETLDPMIASSQYIESLMSDQEASERGFLISANPSSLDRFNASRAALTALWPIAEKQATALGGEAPVRLARVRLSATTWQMQAADVEINDVRAGFQEDALSAAAAGRSEALFGQFREDSGALAAYLEQIQRQQTGARDLDLTRLRAAEVVLFIGGLLALGLLGYASSKPQMREFGCSTGRAGGCWRTSAWLIFSVWSERRSSLACCSISAFRMTYRARNNIWSECWPASPSSLTSGCAEGMARNCWCSPVLAR